MHCILAKGNTSGLCARPYVRNTKLTPSDSYMPLFFIKSTPGFTDSKKILKANKAHLRPLSLGRILVNEEAM